MWYDPKRDFIWQQHTSDRVFTHVYCLNGGLRDMYGQPYYHRESQFVPTLAQRALHWVLLGEL